MRSVELFAGAGGLGLGTARAGFHHEAVIECNRDANRTLFVNKERGVEYVRDWLLFPGYVEDFPLGCIRPGLDLVSGGPPCQPFSLGGKHRAHLDNRDMFPETARVVRELQPRAFMFENVKGLLRKTFSRYFRYIRLRLEFPLLTIRTDEGWEDHLVRLEQHQPHADEGDLTYAVTYRLLNAAAYGVPQRRERVVIVGFRRDLALQWAFPEPTHTEDALLYDQWVTGEYWDRHHVATNQRPALGASLAGRVAQIRDELMPPPGVAWRTLRDAIADLPDPTSNPASTRHFNHVFNPGARLYKGHTGSPLDSPAKTLKAGDHGVPGGENIVVFPTGQRRYLTVRESARIQGFPDDFVFEGSWTESMRQLGNAVPVPLAYAVARQIAETLSHHRGDPRNAQEATHNSVPDAVLST